MGTPGSLSIRVVDKTGKSERVLEIYTKCNGGSPFELGDKITKFGKIPSISTLRRWCKKLSFGCDKCRKITKRKIGNWHEIEVADVVRFKKEG